MRSYSVWQINKDIEEGFCFIRFFNNGLSLKLLSTEEKEKDLRCKCWLVTSVDIIELYKTTLKPYLKIFFCFEAIFD